jgi:O-antigen ligase
VFGKRTINQAHNGYLDVVIELGSVGLLLLAGCFVGFVKDISNTYRTEPGWACLRSVVVLVALVHNVTESSFLKTTALLWSVVAMCLVSGVGVSPLIEKTKSSL